MAGFGGRIHRSGKRSVSASSTSSSTSSYFSMVTVIVFLAFCLLGMWMFTSSSIVPLHVLPNREVVDQSRTTTFSLSPPPLSEGNSNSVTFDKNTDDSADQRKIDESEERGKDIGSNSAEETKEEQEVEEEKEMQHGVMDKNGDDVINRIEGEAEKMERMPEKKEKEKEKEVDDENIQVPFQTVNGLHGPGMDNIPLPTVSDFPFPDDSEDERSEPQQRREDDQSSESKDDHRDSLRFEGNDGRDRERLEHKESENKAEEFRLDDVEPTYFWGLCDSKAGADYIPCLDNEKALKKVHNTGHYEHRERHCPEQAPWCLVPLPIGYRQPVLWPKSRDKIWYSNVPKTKLAKVKGHQNWVKVKDEHLIFPGGGTQFIHGALHYIDFIQKAVPRISWGKHTRVILDVGCGVASLGGYLFERDVITMSFAPKDEHEAQVQFALERGIPAVSAVMGTQRLPFPSKVFDVVHCARCRVPWHIDGGILLLELNRLLRPGGYFVWSATPVYQKLKDDVDIWNAMTALTKSMCWDLVTIQKDRLNSVGAAIYRKPVSNACYENRRVQEPPFCTEEDDEDAAWYVPLQACIHKVPIHTNARGSRWPVEWPHRLEAPPYWLNNSQTGIYGKPANEDFVADYEHWKQVVSESYLNGMDINWSKVRNVMDMRAIYGGFAAALKDKNIWVMNVVNIDSPDTLTIIYERGLFGIYHDWCESFSTYPRTYDLLHADHLLSELKRRCEILPVIVEVDRILRPFGKLILRDEREILKEVMIMLKSLHWEVRLTFSKGNEGILCGEKSFWRPNSLSPYSSKS